MEVELNKMKAAEKFYLWRERLTQKQRKNIKDAINICILVLLVFGFFTVYKAGVQNGQIQLCAEQNLVLVEYQGVKDCWSEEQLQFHVDQFDQTKQLEEALTNELQYNIN